MLRQRLPRIENKAFLAFVRKQRCCACGHAPPVQAAHLRRACHDRGKRATGMGERPDDRWAVPLCAACHLDGQLSVHRTSEEAFFKRTGIDPFEVADLLWERFSRCAK